MLYQSPKSPYWQYDFQHKGRRFYGSTGCKSRRAAEAYEARVRHEALSAPRLARPPISLDHAAGLYALRIEAKPGYRTSRGILKALVTGLGPTRLLSEISQADLTRFVARRRNGRKDSSVNREIHDWRAMWRWAERQRHDIGEMPDWSALTFREPETAARELTAAEEARLFQHLRPDLHPLALFALKSGWRVSEIIALTWAAVDLETQSARTKIKGGATIIRPLSRQMLAIISSQPKVCPQVFTFISQSSRISHSTRDGRKRTARRAGERYPFSQSGWGKPWREALKAAEIEGFTFHGLRHTAGSRVTRQTGNIFITQKILAHRSIKSTMRYVHALDADVRGALDATDSQTIPGKIDQQQKAVR